MSPWDKAVASVKDASALKIRSRTLRGRVHGHYMTWGEYQVVEGRTIRWRAETKEQAEEFIAAATKGDKT